MEFIAVTFSLWSVILTIRRSVWCWGIGAIGIIAYFICFGKVELYAQMALQVIFLTQAIIGWYHWNHNVDNSDKITKVDNLSYNWRILLIVVSAIIIIVLSVLSDFTTTPDITFLDLMAAIFSLLANWLIVKRKMDGWYVWIFVDIILIILFFKVGLILSAVLYFVFMCLAILGIFQWAKFTKTV